MIRAMGSRPSSADSEAKTNAEAPSEIEEEFAADDAELHVEETQTSVVYISYE